ncbi:hypothetical protein PR202_ga08112 [Eleusine coracana subsp. coracana]|uniref:Uncharacterized protein n=1 Tax=Eleusine coracana subsp. coracana TaxID=191504 RepID=A0AAV5BZC0_ELECO|nr:hypothetical protein PR202_ga08112 [Eleusine coracana subsp. coracana]
MFWTNRWIHGCSVQNLAPSVFAVVPMRIRDNRSVAEALVDEQWILDIQGGLSWTGIRELLRLCDCLENIALTDQEDRHVWNLVESGHYSSRSAYKAYFFGSISFEPWKQLWKAWHLLSVSSFFGSPSETSVGRPTDLLRGDLITQKSVLFAIKKRKRFSIYS